MAFLSSPGSNNEVDTATIQVSTANTPVNTISFLDNTANLSDATVSPRSQENRPRNQDISRKTMIVEDTSSKAMVAIDGAGFNWSYMADNEVPTNMALMAFSDLEVSDSDEYEYEEMVVKSKNVQHKPEQVNQPRKVSQNPRNNKTNWNEMRTQKLGVGFQFTNKACFVYGSFSHPIKDCDFHDKKMVQKPVLKTVEKGNGQREVRPVWNNTMRVNHQNFSNSRRNFAPTAVLTKSGIEISPFSQTIKNMMEDLLLLKAVLKEKEKQHKASCKSKLVNSASQPLQIIHMDLFGSNFIKSIIGKMYCIVVTDDYSRCDNGTEFKNYEMNQFCRIKRIKREFSNARTPQQNGVAERKNKTLIEAARTMLADSLLPIPFWTEAVNIAYYVQNRVLVTKPHNKTHYELLIGRAPIISFMRPFGCLVTILNTLDHLGKFDGKADEGFLVGYSINSKAFRWSRMAVDIDSLTNLMNYQPVNAGNRTNVLNTSLDVPSSNEEVVSSPKDDAGKKSILEPTCVEGGKIDDLRCLDQQMKSIDDSENTSSTNSFNIASPTINTASDKDGTFQRTYGEWNFSTPITFNAVSFSFSHPAALDDFPKMSNLEDTKIFNDAYDDRD
nr:hypothetical protein [Tanacetum cinerariifolium]